MIHNVLERVKKDGEHQWWEILFGWFPRATGALNLILHSIVILLTHVILCLLLNFVLYVKVWRTANQITKPPCVYNTVELHLIE